MCFLTGRLTFSVSSFSAALFDMCLLCCFLLFVCCVYF